ncbi:MAG TPA: SDR family oxidoreductase [Pseudolabrys sp.]|nr:SDR family oxidoreductase [Pseudolabrys sp.]
MKPLDGRRAIVTGAAQGIGAGIAEALRAAGAVVVGLDRKDTPGGDLMACELLDERQISDAVSSIAGRLGGIDILVNNAAINERRSLIDIEVAHLERMWGVNVRAPVLMAKAVVPHMPQGGRIINIASELAYLGRENSSIYAATKGAILSLTRSWARELSPDILVNAIAPGPTDTPLLNFAYMPPERQAAEMQNPMKRIGTVKEVAATAVFLCGDGGNFYTGQCLGPNGGAAMY